METPASAATPASDFLHAPLELRGAALLVLAGVASLFALQWAKQFLVPLLMGVMLSYALAPIVNWLHRRRMPRAISAGLLLTSILVATSWGAWSLSDQINDLIETLPQVTHKIREMTRHERGSVSAIERVQQAALELEAAADGVATGSSAPARTAARPAPAHDSTTPRIDVRAYVLSGTLGAFALLGQIAVVCLIALFLMASGNSFRRKMVKLAGPRLSQKKITIETLDEITEQIQRYLIVQVGMSLLVGVATWLAFYAIGLHEAAVWGVAAAVTNFVPYVGALLLSGGSAVVGLVQFGTPGMAVLVGGSSLLIHSIVGNLLTPWWMGRASRMSPLAVFVAVLLFGWLWGIAGLLLGVPILLVVKAVCDRVDGLKPLGELLGV